MYLSVDKSALIPSLPDTSSLPPSVSQDASQPAVRPQGASSPSGTLLGAPEAALPTPFPTDATAPELQPCSYNECLTGHKWPAVLALAKCPGCSSAVQAVQKTNCPFCNEPIIRTVLRSDFLPRGGGVVARCQGQVMPGDSLDIQLQRTSWQAAEVNTRTFLEQQAVEATEIKAKEATRSI